MRQEAGEHVGGQSPQLQGQISHQQIARRGKENQAESAGQQQRVELSLMNLLDLVAAERHPDRQDRRRQGEDFEEETEVVQDDHAVKKQTGLGAVKIEGHDQRDHAADRRDRRQDLFAARQQVEDDDQQDRRRENDLRQKETQAGDVFQVHGLTVEMGQDDLIELIEGRSQEIEHHARVNADDDHDHTQRHQREQFAAVDFRQR